MGQGGFNERNAYPKQKQTNENPYSFEQHIQNDMKRIPCLVTLTKPIAILESLIHTFLSLSLDTSYIFKKIMSILQLRKLDSGTENEQ